MFCIHRVAANSETNNKKQQLHVQGQACVQSVHLKFQSIENTCKSYSPLMKILETLILFSLLSVLSGSANVFRENFQSFFTQVQIGSIIFTTSSKLFLLRSPFYSSYATDIQLIFALTNQTLKMVHDAAVKIYLKKIQNCFLHFIGLSMN